MKKVYLVEINADFACHEYCGYEFEYYLNNTYWKIFPTLKEARKYMRDTKDAIKEKFKDEIAIESKRNNTLTIDIQKYDINDDKDFFKDRAVYLEELWNYEHALVDSRYLCGRY